MSPPHVKFNGTKTHVTHDTVPCSPSQLNPATAALHADDLLNVVDDVAPPMHLSTTYRYPNDPESLFSVTERGVWLLRFLPPVSKSPALLDDMLSQRLISLYHDRSLTILSQAPSPTEHVYSRHTTSSTTRFETILGVLLKNPAVVYASGLSAIHAALTFLNPSRISIGDGYHGSHGVIAIHERLTGMKKLPLDCEANSLHEGDLILLETPVNPTGKAFHIEEYAKKAHSRGAYLMVDSTFAPPNLQDPFLWGADLVMHSGTKYLGGHSDMLCGVLCVKRKEWVAKLKEERTYLGNVMGGLEGWLAVRSIRTLEVRVQRQSLSAGKIVSWLDDALHSSPDSEETKSVQAVVEKVEHASLQKSDMDWLKIQMPNGFGPVFALSMRYDEAARKLPSKLSFFHHATSLGGVESLIEWRTMTDATVSRRLLRISIGLEGWEDLRDDLAGAFVQIAKEINVSA